MAPAPHAALSVIARAGQPGAGSSGDLPSEPASPLLRDGGTLLDPTPNGSCGPGSAAPSPPNGLLGSGAGLCRLACGATAEESTESKRVSWSIVGCHVGCTVLSWVHCCCVLQSGRARLACCVAASDAKKLGPLAICSAPRCPVPPCALQMQRKLIAALCLAFLFMLVEVAGGIYAHSLAM